MTDEVRSPPRDLSALRINRDPDRPHSRGPWIVLTLLLLSGAGGFWLWRVAGVPEVETAFVRAMNSGENAILSASGYLLPDRKADVSSKSFGRLDWVGVDVGSSVKKGEVIARLANADVSAEVEYAKAALADAEREHARWQKITDQGIEPRERLDKAETAVQLARARLKAADAAHEYTLIRAPFDGVVVKRLAQMGELVGPIGNAGGTSTSGSLCTLVDRASLEMVADVNETNIGKIKAGQKAGIVADARPDRTYKGEVRQIVPTADRQKGIIQVKIRLLDPDDALLPEMAARATFLREGTGTGGLRRIIAPRGSVRERDGRKGVLVFEGGRVRFQAVEMGADGEEVLSGLQGGEQVVTGGAVVEDGAGARIKEKN
jgi:RND family efflux transporter MFP subunit